MSAPASKITCYHATFEVYPAGHVLVALPTPLDTG